MSEAYIANNEENEAVNEAVNTAPDTELQEESAGKAWSQDEQEAAQEIQQSQKHSSKLLSKANWYIVQVYSGFEVSVMESIKHVAKLRGISSLFPDFFVPLEKEQDAKVLAVAGLKGGKKKSLYPGYIFIKMEMNDETWNTVVKTNRAIGFSGSDKMSPKPITDAEFERMVKDINSKAEKVVAQSNFNVGDKVKITHGSFQGIIGSVSGIEGDKKRLNVVLKIFDRETAIDISTDEVELVKE